MTPDKKGNHFVLVAGVGEDDGRQCGWKVLLLFRKSDKRSHKNRENAFL